LKTPEKKRTAVQLVLGIKEKGNGNKKREIRGRTTEEETSLRREKQRKAGVPRAKNSKEIPDTRRRSQGVWSKQTSNKREV